ncbi:MAG: GGDEF domain-containing protein [Oscillospiraceae bacterium]|nr:GGDEF domain-containing protein [Oscillospiraceae bacterium]
MKAKTNKDNSGIYFMFYIFAAVLTLAIFFIGIIFGYSPQFGTDSELYSYGDRWYTDEEMTEEADLKHPNLVQYTEACFYSAVPDTVKSGDNLWFKVKNCFISVDVNGVTMAEISKSDFPNEKSPGTAWISVPLDSSDIGKTMTIRLTTYYNDSSACIDNVYIGSGISSFQTALKGRLAGSVTCILLIFVGFMLVVSYFILSFYVKDIPKQLLYLGCFSFMTALWSFSELKVFQLFTDKTPALHTLSCMSLMLIAMPLFMIYKNELDKQNKAIIPLISFVTILNFAVCTILHFTGLYDFHEALTCTHIAIGIGAVGIVYANYLLCFKAEKKSRADILAACGMVSIAIAAVVDIVRYRQGGVDDSSLFTRIALLFYVITLGIRSLGYVIKLVTKGLKTDIISRLAYEDGLTGLGNRTAYKERLAEISSAAQPFTVFVFDINNLKAVNDNLGHTHGDELIILGAKAISDTFGNIGKCYRIGGDEFICLITDKCDPAALSEKFCESIACENETLEEFTLSVAYGFSVYNGTGSADSAVSSADKRMYEKKKELKENPCNA